MTEVEARKKLCPILIAGFYAGDAKTADTSCSASACMMWVWDTTPAQVAVINAQRSVEHSPYIEQPCACGHCGLIR